MMKTGTAQEEPRSSAVPAHQVAENRIAGLPTIPESVWMSTTPLMAATRRYEAKAKLRPASSRRLTW